MFPVRVVFHKRATWHVNMVHNGLIKRVQEEPDVVSDNQKWEGMPPDLPGQCQLASTTPV